MNVTLLVVGIILLLIGIGMVIAGIVIHEQRAQSNQSQPWYVWLLIIGGIVVAIVAGLMMGYAAKSYPKKQEYEYPPPPPLPCGSPPRYITPSAVYPQAYTGAEFPTVYPGTVV